MHSAQNFGANNFVTPAFFGIEVKFGALRDKHGNGHENSPNESCGALDRCILHGNLARANL